MTKGIVLAALVVATFSAALLMHVSESDASFHLNRIDGAMAGFNGDSTIHYVELRSANFGQNLLASNSAVLCFFDSTGAPYAMFKFPTNPANSADGASYLVGTAEFDAAWAAGSPDFTFTGNTTAIPGGGDTPYPIRAPGGKISFGSDFTVTPSMMCQTGVGGSFSPIDSVVYGTAAYGGIVDYGAQLTSDLPTSSTMGLHIVGPVCIEFSSHPCGSPRNNSVNYSIVDVNAAGNQPRNSLNLSGPIAIVDADGDGVLDASDLCPGTAPSTTVDANGCSQAQVDRDLDTICDPGAPSAGPAPGCTGSDNCPAWANTAQALPAWPVPPGDSDCDGFPNTVQAIAYAPESFIGTDATKQCAADTTANNEPLPDAWPMDFNDDQKVNTSDVLHYTAVFNTMLGGPPGLGGGSYSVRYDLNGDGHINTSDILHFTPFFNKSCT